MAAPSLIGAAAPAKPALIGAPPATPNLHEKEIARLESNGPGVNHIQSPFLRTLAKIGDVAGSIVAPRAMSFIPGTTLHNQQLINTEQGHANEEAKREGETAQAAHTQAETEAIPAETELKSAQAEEAKARAESLRNPQPKQEEAGKTITTDQGIMQWNPKTQRYDIQAGNAPEKKESGTVHQLEDGSLIIAHPDGTASAVTLNGQPVRGQAKQPSENEEERNIQAYLKEHNLEDNATNRGKAKKFFAEAGKEPPDRGQNFYDPATGKLIRVEPGGNVPKGAVSASGLSTENVKEQETAQAAEKARSDAQKEYQLAQQLVAHPSPTNDVALIMRYIGATKPDSLGKLRLNQNEISLVLGTRSAFGDLEALANKISNGQRLTDKQRHDMLDSMKLLTGAGEGGNELPGGVSLDEVNAEIERRKKGKK